MIVKPEKANSHIRGSNSPSAPIKTIIQQYSDYQCGSSRKSWIWCIKNWFVLCVPLYCPEISNLLMIQKYFIISLHILFLFIVSFFIFITVIKCLGIGFFPSFSTMLFDCRSQNRNQCQFKHLSLIDYIS